jgi:hypothetical protein
MNFWRIGDESLRPGGVRRRMQSAAELLLSFSPAAPTKDDSPRWANWRGFSFGSDSQSEPQPVKCGPVCFGAFPARSVSFQASGLHPAMPARTRREAARLGARARTGAARTICGRVGRTTRRAAVSRWMTGFLAARAGRWTCSGRTIWTPALRLSRGVPAKAEQAEKTRRRGACFPITSPLPVPRRYTITYTEPW